MKNIFVFFKLTILLKKCLLNFFQIILGANVLSSQEYGAKVIFDGKIQPHVTIIKDVFQIKKENNMKFYYEITN